jgi:purine-binding chemotaxis protein CheW
MQAIVQQQSAQRDGAQELSDSHQYLSFTLGKEAYAIDILKVQEIRGYEAVTPIANTPAYIKGVTNLRGNIVPIVDLRLKFNVGEASYNEFTVVIILNLGARVVGIVVDGVSDVVLLKGGDIRPAPQFSSVFDTRYVSGLAMVGEQMLIVVDIEQLIRGSDLMLFDDAANAARG